MARMARGLVLALCVSGASAGSATVEGTTKLTTGTFDAFIADAIGSGKTAMVRWIASEG